MYTQKPDIADDVTVCYSNQTHPSSDDSTQDTDEEEWTDSNDVSLGANEHSINITLGVLDTNSFQYYKGGARETNVSADQTIQ